MPGPRLPSPPGGEIRVFPDPTTLAAAVADEFARAALDAVSARGRFAVALAGGSTPKLAYAKLAAAQESGVLKLPWDRIHVFFGDERCVPPEHPDSNFRMARESLLGRVSIPPANVHVLRGGDVPEEAAAAGERDLIECFHLRPGEFPRFDLVMLGLGPDGHTASLFPGTAAIEERARLVVANHVPKLGAWRLTLTFPVLNAAAEALFTAAGKEKAQVLREVVRPAADGPSHPATRVRPADGRVVWFADDAAAGGLSGNR